MLNNIRGILNRRSDSVKSPESGSEGNGESSSAEGFLCPQCFHKFPTPDALQNHYESTHAEGISDVTGKGQALSCPECRMKMGSEIELRAHFNRHHEIPKGDIEMEAMSMQIKALEEGKALLQRELEDMRSENISIKEERDEFKLKANKLTDDLAETKLQFDTVKAQRLSLESSLEIYKERVKSLEIEIQQRFATDDVTVLKNGLVSVQQMMDELNQKREMEKMELEKQCNTLQETCTKLATENAKLENLLSDCPKEEDIASFQETIFEMAMTTEQLKSDISGKDAEISQLSAALQKFKNYDDIKRQLLEKSNSAEEMEKVIEEKTTMLSKLDVEIANLKVKIEEMKADREQLFSKIQEGEGASAAMLQLQEENLRLQGQFSYQQELANQISQENEAKVDELKCQLKKSASDLQLSSVKCTDLSKDLEKLKKELKSTEEKNNEITKGLNAQVTKLSEMIKGNKKYINELEEKLDKSHKEIDELKQQVKGLVGQLKEENITRERNIQQIQLEKTSLENRLSDLGQTLPRVQEELLKRNNELQETMKKVQNLNDGLKNRDEILKEKESELKRIHSLYDDVVIKMEELEITAARTEASKIEFCDKISMLNEQLLERQMRESELSSVMDTLNETKTQFSEKCSSLEEENKNLRSSVTTLQNEKNSLLSEVDKVKKLVSDLNKSQQSQESQLSEFKQLYDKAKEMSEKVLKESNIAKEMFLKEKLKLQKQIESLETDCAKQVFEIQQTATSLGNQLEESEEKNAVSVSSLEEVKKSLKQKERELEESAAQHTAKHGLLIENVKTLKEDLLSEQKKKDLLQQTLDEVSEEKLGLEAKLSNALDERNGLLERCLRSESEWEKVQRVHIEMRRKYDESVAALQELGRENQTLQVENMRHMSRKWADDSEVSHCTTCSKLFSVTIRKHHCRNCGEIFCNECSAKTATVASSKKPVRVCDVCYLEVTK